MIYFFRLYIAGLYSTSCTSMLQTVVGPAQLIFALEKQNKTLAMTNSSELLEF